MCIFIPLLSLSWSRQFRRATPTLKNTWRKGCSRRKLSKRSSNERRTRLGKSEKRTKKLVSAQTVQDVIKRTNKFIRGRGRPRPEDLPVCPGLVGAQCIYIYIYIYMYRERERERERDTSLSLYIYTYIHVNIYVYIYI